MGFNPYQRNKMKNLFLYLSILFVIASCSQGDQSTNTKTDHPTEQEWIFHNNSSLSWNDHPVIISRDKFQLLEENPNFKFIDEKRKDIPFQLDDLDGDGQWDEAFLLLNSDPKSKRIISAVFVDKPIVANFKQRANVHFGKKKAPYQEINSAPRRKASDEIKASDLFQMEGPAWENEHVAFRNYYDQRNGIDIFGKQTNLMVLDSVGIEGTNYHELADWGMDILKVGNSLGAGAIALKKDGKIYRIDQSDVSEYKLIADGPLRAILQLSFDNFKIGERSYFIKHQISIWGGTQFYQSSVTIDGIQGDEELVTGIVNLHSSNLHEETINKYVILATHDMQAENKAMLGMGLLIPKAIFIGQEEAPKDGNGVVSTYMAMMKIENKKPVTFFFYSGWENQDKGFKDMEYFLNVMKRDVR